MSVRGLVRKEVYDILDTDLAVEYGSPVPYKSENHKVVVPHDAPYLIVWFRYPETRKASLGTTRKFTRHRGLVMIDVVVPVDTGTGALWKLVDSITEVFRERALTLEDGSYLTFMVPESPGTPRPQDAYYFITTMIPFVLDECGEGA
jgi:hypothetical protein